MPTNEYSMLMFWGTLNNYLQIIRFSNVPGWDSYETQQPLWAVDSVQYNPFEQIFFKHISFPHIAVMSSTLLNSQGDPLLVTLLCSLAFFLSETLSPWHSACSLQLLFIFPDSQLHLYNSRSFPDLPESFLLVPLSRNSLEAINLEIIELISFFWFLWDYCLALPDKLQFYIFFLIYICFKQKNTQ